MSKSNFKLLTRINEKWTKEQTEYIKNTIHYHSIGNVSKKFVKETIFGLYNDLHCENDTLGSCIKMPTKYLLLISLHIDFITCQKIGQIVKNIKSRSDISVKTGKDMLFWIKDFVKEYNLKQHENNNKNNKNNKNEINSITLNSTDDVLGFYWKYGWKFKNITRNENFWNERIQLLNSYQNSKKREIILKKYFDSYLEGFYKYSNKEDLRMSGYKMVCVA